MKYLLLSILFLASCSTPDCSNRAAQLNAYYESHGIKTYIAVCPYGKGQSHCYLIINGQWFDAVTEAKVMRDTTGCIIFDEPAVLSPYMTEKQFNKEWR